MTRFDKYTSFTAAHFAADEQFISWVKFPDDQNEKFWADFLEAYPDKAGEMKKARSILQEIKIVNENPSQESEQKVWNAIQQGLGNVVVMHPRRRYGRIIAYAAAASVALIFLVGYFYQNRTTQNRNPIQPMANTGQDVDPGGNRAILTLADGTKILLDSANNGAITKQGNVTVTKLKDGKIEYDFSNSSPNSTASNVAYNTISTPRGGQYQLVLADGSKVWLNAESSVTFPTAFVGKDRNVTMTGEAYFEVAHDASKPFMVTANNTEVKVLGTHFNINGYDGETRTTLLEGSVAVESSGKKSRITPGQQAVTNINNNAIVVLNDVNLEEVMAWKNGYFFFRHADVEMVMKQLSRWYDVDIIYQGDIPDRRFEGEMQRNLSLSQVLNLLGKNNIHFSIVGKKIIVSP